MAMKFRSRAASIGACALVLSRGTDGLVMSEAGFRLQGLRSPAGKLTLSVELDKYPKVDVMDIPIDYKDQWEEMSSSCRTAVKANCLVAQEEDTLVAVVEEQSKAMGDFPGPCPVLFAPWDKNNAVAWDADMCAEAEDQVARAAEVGATGLVVPVEMEGSGEVKDLATLEKLAGVASAKGIAIVPEIRCCDHTPGGDSAALAGALRGVSAAADTSVALVAGSMMARLVDTHEDDDEGFPIFEADVQTTEVRGDLSKEMIVLARVDVPPGQGLLACAVSSLEANGYTGAILGAKCVPPVESPVHAGVYWSMAMGALRNKKSQTFGGIRTKITASFYGANDRPDAWMNYMESALENSGINEHMKGDPIRDGNDLIEADPTAPNLRTDRGDWKGF